VRTKHGPPKHAFTHFINVFIFGKSLHIGEVSFLSKLVLATYQCVTNKSWSYNILDYQNNRFFSSLIHQDFILTFNR
jgi:hypothetical protein